MKRIGAGIALALLLLALLAKPADKGAAYDPYFAALNQQLKRQGPGQPVLVLDLQRVEHNLDQIMAHMQPPKQYRIVCKSLPSLPFLGHIMQYTGTNRLMVFRTSFARQVLQSYPETDLLFGKPMPVNAAANFYSSLTDVVRTRARTQVHWLIDSETRLLQYQQLAQAQAITLSVNIEIDVGLHRGGLKDTKELQRLLAIIAADPQLVFDGFMGYDAHVAAAPAVLSSQPKALQDVVDTYQRFVQTGQEAYPELFRGQLNMNGAGSKTYMLYDDQIMPNDLSVGSAVVKPTSYDVPQLQAHLPAFFIATPVLKRLAGTHIPYVEFLDPLVRWWDPNRALTYFLFDGGWMAEYESPAGLVENSLYGFSTNQAFVNGSLQTNLQADDYIFLRPTQSEVVMRQFGALWVVRDGQFEGRWDVFEEE